MADRKGNAYRKKGPKKASNGDEPFPIGIDAKKLEQVQMGSSQRGSSKKRSNA